MSPSERVDGAIPGGGFRTKRLMLREDHLEVYVVTDVRGTAFEAQVFSLSCPQEKLRQARRRRMKRIFRSQNFKCVFEQAGKRFLISQVERSDAEWRNLQARAEQHQCASAGGRTEEPARHAAVATRTESGTPPHALASLPPGHGSPGTRPASYAQAVKSQDAAGLSTAPNGVRQPRGRQFRKREKVPPAIN